MAPWNALLEHALLAPAIACFQQPWDEWGRCVAEFVGAWLEPKVMALSRPPALARPAAERSAACLWFDRAPPPTTRERTPCRVLKTVDPRRRRCVISKWRSERMVL